jgi:hypothetical protein
VELPGCNPAQQALGTFILWLGWYGFNPGSTQCFYGCMEVGHACFLGDSALPALNQLSRRCKNLHIQLQAAAVGQQQQPPSRRPMPLPT